MINAVPHKLIVYNNLASPNVGFRSEEEMKWFILFPFLKLQMRVFFPLEHE